MTLGVIDYAQEHGRWEILDTRRTGTSLAGIQHYASRVDGVLFGLAGVEDPRLKYLASQGTPTVRLGGPEPSLVPVVCPDTDAIGRLACEHFLEMGLEYLGACGNRRVPHVRDRIEAYQKALTQKGYTCLKDETDHLVSGSLDWLERIAELKEWLLQLPKPVGIYAPDLTEARDLATACYELNLDVPEEVSLLGTGNDERCLLTSPNLSTVDFGSRRIGRRAAELLESLIEGQAPPSGPVLVQPTGVVSRQSTDALAIQHPEVVRAVRWIRENIEYGPDVAEVTEQTRVSRRTLELHFKKALGRTIGQEIRRCRVERARFLLRRTQLPMIDVAVRSGFSSRSHMNQELRRAIEMSPKEYRRSMR